MKSLIHKPLSLITKTRIRGLDAFTWPRVLPDGFGSTAVIPPLAAVTGGRIRRSWVRICASHLGGFLIVGPWSSVWMWGRSSTSRAGIPSPAATSPSCSPTSSSAASSSPSPSTRPGSRSSLDSPARPTSRQVRRQAYIYLDRSPPLDRSQFSLVRSSCLTWCDDM